MTKIRFKPFVGSQYNNTNCRILILGESHYLCGDDLLDYENNEPYIQNITQNVVLEFLKYGKSFLNIFFLFIVFYKLFYFFIFYIIFD